MLCHLLTFAVGVIDMVFLDLWNYIRGYVIIRVEGIRTEKFVNICLKREIGIWDFENESGDNNKYRYKMSISLKDFTKRVRPVAFKSKCRVKVLERRGLIFEAKKYKKRKLIIIAALSACMAFYLLSSLLWSIQIVGSNETYELDAKRIISDMGIKPGVFVKSINVKKISDNIILKQNNITWVGVTIKGTRMYISLEDGVKNPGIIPRDEPCDIIASKDAIIKSIIVKEGELRVAKGDSVLKGQVLVSGLVKSIKADILPRLVHSQADILARVWYNSSVQVDMKMVKNVNTGRQCKDKKLIFFGLEFGNENSKNKYKEYNVIEIQKYLTLPNGYELPLGTKEITYLETDKVSIELNGDEAVKQAKIKALRDVEEKLPKDCDIIDTNLEIVDDQMGGLQVSVSVECIENIGVKVETVLDGNK